MEDSDSQHEQEETSTIFLNNDEPEIYIATHENANTGKLVVA